MGGNSSLIHLFAIYSLEAATYIPLNDASKRNMFVLPFQTFGSFIGATR